MKKIVIAIDGHSSCGKSTFAKSIAKKLGYVFVDTGAMYRAVTLYALKNNMFVNNELNTSLLESSLVNVDVDFSFDTAKQQSLVFLLNVFVPSSSSYCNIHVEYKPMFSFHYSFYVLGFYKGPTIF